MRETIKETVLWFFIDCPLASVTEAWFHGLLTPLRSAVGQARSWYGLCALWGFTVLHEQLEWELETGVWEGVGPWITCALYGGGLYIAGYSAVVIYTSPSKVFKGELMRGWRVDCVYFLQWFRISAVFYVVEDIMWGVFETLFMTKAQLYTVEALCVCQTLLQFTSVYSDCVLSKKQTSEESILKYNTSQTPQVHLFWLLRMNGNNKLAWEHQKHSRSSQVCLGK